MRSPGLVPARHQLRIHGELVARDLQATRIIRRLLLRVSEEGGVQVFAGLGALRLVGAPWGPIYTLQTIGQNSAGGLQSADLNADLLAAVGGELAQRGEIDEAAKALERSLELRDQPEVRQFLWALEGARLTPADEAAGADVPASRDEPGSVDAGLPVTTGLLPSFRPGDMVTWREVALLRQEPFDDSDILASLDPDQAIVTRTSGHWAHVRTIGGQDGWLPAHTLSEGQ